MCCLLQNAFFVRRAGVRRRTLRERTSSHLAWHKTHARTLNLRSDIISAHLTGPLNNLGQAKRGGEERLTCSDKNPHYLSIHSHGQHGIAAKLYCFEIPKVMHA